MLDVPLWIPQFGIAVSGALLALGFLSGNDNLAEPQEQELS